MLSTNQTIGSLRNCEELYFDFPLDMFYSSVPVKTVQKHLMVVELRPVAVFVLLLSLHFRLLSRSSDLSVTLSSCWTVCCCFKFSPPVPSAHESVSQSSNRMFPVYYYYFLYQIKCLCPGGFLCFNICHPNKPPVRQQVEAAAHYWQEIDI